jgi:hypothetical protein
MKKIRSLALASLFVLSVTPLLATTLTESFTNDPAADGWQVFGDTNLFQWNAASNNLAVTWDSSQRNSYFYHPLGVTLNSTNDFMLAFDFQLTDIAIGTDPSYPSTFQIAIGLLNFAAATTDGFIIGTGYQAPDVVEMDYFPAFSDTYHHYSASVSTPMISSDNNFAEGGFTVPLTLVPGAHYHTVLTYTADNQTLHTTLSSNGVPVGPMQDSQLWDGFGDFSVDTFSINSYSQAGQDTSIYTQTNYIDGVGYPYNVIYAGSVLAHGTVNKIFFSSPLPVTQILAATPGSVQFSSTTNWLYTLERTTDFQSWMDVSAPTLGTIGAMILSDTNAPTGKAFYRIRADQP